MARGIKEYEIGFECTAAALHVAGKDKTIAGALARFSIKSPGGDPSPDRELRPKFRAMPVRRCRSTDVDMTSDDRGLNACRDHFRSPAQSAFEGPLPPGRMWRPPRVDLIDVALGRIHRSIRGEWSGMRAVPASDATVEGAVSEADWVYQRG